MIKKINNEEYLKENFYLSNNFRTCLIDFVWFIHCKYLDFNSSATDRSSDSDWDRWKKIKFYFLVLLLFSLLQIILLPI
jgi:hypothetical protein